MMWFGSFLLSAIQLIVVVTQVYLATNPNDAVLPLSMGNALIIQQIGIVP